MKDDHHRSHANRYASADDISKLSLRSASHIRRRPVLRKVSKQHWNEVERHAAYSISEYRPYPTYDFFQEILSHGAEVEILSPEWVRKECRTLIEDMYKLYRKK